MTLLPQPLVIDTYMLQKLGQQIFVTNLEKNGEVWTEKEWKKLYIVSWWGKKQSYFLLVDDWIGFLKQKLITSHFLRILPKSRTDSVTWNINTAGLVNLELKLTNVTYAADIEIALLEKFRGCQRMSKTGELCNLFAGELL